MNQGFGRGPSAVGTGGRTAVLLSCAVACFACSTRSAPGDLAGAADIGDDSATCLAPRVLCNGTCTDITSDLLNCGACTAPCDAATGEICLAGKCSCPAGLSVCAGKCVDTQVAQRHCGGCGNDCEACGGTCMGGQCFAGCPAPKIQCRPPGQYCPVCVALWTDSHNCGACGFVCPAGAECSEGRCQ